MTQDTQQPKRPDLILTKIQELEKADRKKVIKTRSRRTKVREEYVGKTLGIFNGQGSSIGKCDERINAVF